MSIKNKTVRRRIVKLKVDSHFDLFILISKDYVPRGPQQMLVGFLSADPKQRPIMDAYIATIREMPMRLAACTLVCDLCKTG